jgi:integrase
LPSQAGILVLAMCLRNLRRSMVMAGNRTALTADRIKRATCPPGVASKTGALVWDSVQPGLVLRVYPNGRKVFFAFYRVGSGRKAPQRWDRIGDADAIALKDARDAAKARMGAVAKGGDPAGERRAEAKRERARLKPALDDYEADLARRKVVKRGEVMSLLRRELFGPLGNVDLASLTRNDLVKRIREVEAGGRPGTAKELKTRAGVFLSWCVDHGLMTASPLAGWRQQRRTRAERLEKPGRALADWELRELWKAADAQGWPFGPYLQMLLLLGQRRTETALMAWSDLDLDQAVWTVPPETTKSGRPHKIPLSVQAVTILRNHKRAAKSDLVFPGRRNQPMTGWSKRLPPVYRLTTKAGMAPWSLHDLRRTARTGLGRLGVDRVVAELLIDHAISDELAAIYDRGDYWRLRVEAAQRWADHVMGAIDAADKVVSFRAAK